MENENEVLLQTLFDDSTGHLPTNDAPFISFDMWGTCSLRNFRRLLRVNRSLKPLRVHLLTLVLKFCELAGVDTFVYGGTALGVYRENGQMIRRDSDIDLATLEYDSTSQGVFTKLLKTCLENGVEFSGVDHAIDVESRNPLYPIRLEFSSGTTMKRWLRVNEDGEIEEQRYNGLDCKRAKFFYSLEGLREACKLFRKSNRIQRTISFDPSLVHVDLFTLSKHPASPDTHFRVNWNIPGVYDCSEKQFPIDVILPCRPCMFEGVVVQAPADLKSYLEVEYGYLGRDAMYDSASQRFVQVPQDYLRFVPKCLL